MSEVQLMSEHSPAMESAQGSDADNCPACGAWVGPRVGAGPAPGATSAVDEAARAAIARAEAATEGSLVEALRTDVPTLARAVLERGERIAALQRALAESTDDYARRLESGAQRVATLEAALADERTLRCEAMTPIDRIAELEAEVARLRPVVQAAQRWYNAIGGFETATASLTALHTVSEYHRVEAEAWKARHGSRTNNLPTIHAAIADVRRILDEIERTATSGVTSAHIVRWERDDHECGGYYDVRMRVECLMSG